MRSVMMQTGFLLAHRDVAFKTFPDVAAGFASYPISARTKFFKDKGK